MKVTREQIEAKEFEAKKASQIGWLDTVKMETYGIKTSKPMKLTGWEPKENPFRECQQPNPRRH
jgi:hypothetical protein